uniref:Receptor ligand binding region domain-containing protein n=1 Tax=Salvator merianae TaxID=96440 RepID=A0A8D0BZA1_SALMN
CCFLWCWKNRDKAEECHYDLLLYQSIEIFFTFSTPCRLMPVPKNYQRILAFVFATHEVNKNPFLLPNITMGFHIYDYRENPIKTYEVSLSQLSAQGPFIPNYNCNRLYRLQSVIGGLDSKSSWNMVSYGFGSDALSDKTQFPFIYRMVPKEDTHYPGIIKLLLHFKWTWIGLLVPDTDNGERFLRTFTSLLFSNGICAAFSVLINLQALHLHFQSFFTWYKVNVIVYYGKVWITTALWDITLTLSYDILSSKNIHAFFSFLVHKSKRENYDNYRFLINAMQMFGIKAFQCSYSKHVLSVKGRMRCRENEIHQPLSEEVTRKTLSLDSYNIYNLIKALAQTLDAALSSKPKWDFNRNLLWLQELQPWQVRLFHYKYLC